MRVLCYTEEEEIEDLHDTLEDLHCVESKLSTASEVEAFSHFSYYATGKERFVCDLQGVYRKKENVLKLSDPVIHYYNPGKLRKKSVHGRTDLGRKGIIFCDTHKDCCEGCAD